MRHGFRIVCLLAVTAVVGGWAWAQSNQGAAPADSQRPIVAESQPPASPDTERESHAKGKKTTGPGKNMGQGAGDIGKGAAKGTGDMAKGTAGAAGSLAHGNVGGAGESLGKGAGGLGKNVAVGTGKGVGKIGKGAGGEIKKLGHKSKHQQDDGQRSDAS